jgi:hypothetical protein
MALLPKCAMYLNLTALSGHVIVFEPSRPPSGLRLSPANENMNFGPAMMLQTSTFIRAVNYPQASLVALAKT